MKRTTSFTTLALALLSVLAFANSSRADIVYGDGMLNTSSPTSHVTGQSTSGSGMQYYNLYQFSVDTSGSYVFELSSLNTAGSPSNALDTWMGIFANAFTPPSPVQASNDDFTGTLTVLPGPYAAMGLTSTATGFTGNQPSSRLPTVSLTAGTQYFLYVSSFRDTTFVNTGTTGANRGNYYFGISGPGVISVVPEPTTVALLGLGAVALGARLFRRRKAA